MIKLNCENCKSETDCLYCLSLDYIEEAVCYDCFLEKNKGETCLKK